MAGLGGRERMLRVLGALVSLGVISSMMAVVGEKADAVQTMQPAIVSADPATFTPHVLDGKVEAIAQFGNTVYLGGIFSQVRENNRQLVQTRTNILAFDATTGVISSWAPAVDGEVTSIVVAPDGASLYVGGFFNNIGGQSRRSVARISTTTGLNVAGFSTPNLSGGRVRDMRLSAGKLWIAGQFPSVSGNAQARLATLDATTGRYDPFMNLAVAGVHDPTTNNGGGTTDVVKIDITPDGSRLLGVGNFKTVGGQDRDQIFQLDLTGASATLANWQTNTFKALCVAVFNTYIRDIDYSPDGSFFVVSTTGASRGAASPCDSISRFETGSPGTGLLPTWLTHTGGDTTYAVAVAGDVTYAGGHMRWVNNPYNADSAGQGSISRQGIVALESISGLPYSWNPTRERGVGVFDLLATSQGLWMGSDTDWTGTP